MLYKTYSAEGRQPAVEPTTLFKIIAYAYSQGIYSSREIERACNLNLAFMYLLQGEKAPDHNTIKEDCFAMPFFSCGHKVCFKTIFSTILLLKP